MSPVEIISGLFLVVFVVAVIAMTWLWIEINRSWRYEDAIRKHRDAKGHDRCWENDLELYRVLDEPLPDRLALTEEEFLGGCREYYRRQTR